MPHDLEQVIRYGGGRSLIAAPVLDQAFHPAQGGGPLEHPDLAEHGLGVRGTSGYPDGQHSAEPAAHLALGDLMTWMVREPWVEHRGQRGMLGEAGRDGQRGVRGAVHAQNSVRMPRCSSHASNGPGIAQALRRQDRIRSRRVAAGG